MREHIESSWCSRTESLDGVWILGSRWVCVGVGVIGRWGESRLEMLETFVLGEVVVCWGVVS